MILTFNNHCLNCKSEIGKGLSHYCNEAKSSENFEKILNKTLPEKEKDQLIRSLLKTKAENHKDSNKKKSAWNFFQKGGTNLKLF